MSDLQQWIGRSQHSHDIITPSGVKRFCATLGIEDFPINEHSAAPLGYHWCLCLPESPLSELGEDGHPKKGGFLPPIALPRRMWAASEIEFFADLPIGAEITRISTIAMVTEKIGSTGKLVFVDVDHETQVDGKRAIQERQTIVYREAATKATPLPEVGADATQGWAVVQELLPTPAMLFRYSALTFNSHRIHYDLVYAKETEMYPGLVVHGPLMATLVLQLAASHKEVKKFSYKSKSAAYCNQSLSIAANFSDRNGDLAAIGADGRECLTAQVNF